MWNLHEFAAPIPPGSSVRQLGKPLLYDNCGILSSQSLFATGIRSSYKPAIARGTAALTWRQPAGKCRRASATVQAPPATSRSRNGQGQPKAASQGQVHKIRRVPASRSQGVSWNGGQPCTTMRARLTCQHRSRAGVNGQRKFVSKTQMPCVPGQNKADPK